MHVAVCVKQVPDTWARQSLRADDGTLDRAAVTAVLNELDEYAVEAALQLAEAAGGIVTAVTMGPQSAADVLRAALAQGADAAVQVCDDALHGSDALATSLVLARALERIGAELVVCGAESADARMGILPAMLAERLGFAQLTRASALAVRDRVVHAERTLDGAHETLEATLPAVVSVVEHANEPRNPSLKGMIAAKRKAIETLTCADLGIEPARVGLAGAATAVRAARPRAARAPGRRVAGGAELAAEIADFLAVRASA
jgi:electron transfer flavoprotein beta subunit